MGVLGKFDGKISTHSQGEKARADKFSPEILRESFTSFEDICQKYDSQSIPFRSCDRDNKAVVKVIEIIAADVQAIMFSKIDPNKASCMAHVASLRTDVVTSSILRCRIQDLPQAISIFRDSKSASSVISL